MINRDPEAAAAEEYDLIVIGGGIYGVSLLLEAARRGFRALLLEKGDYGAATSWNSLRIVHGGLRYLQSLDLRRFRESVGERSWFLRHFPDLVGPLPCLMPLYGDGFRRPSVFRLALLLNEQLSRGRNAGLRADRVLLPGRVLTPAETRSLYPAVEGNGLRGGALWYDAAMLSPQRLLVEMLRWAWRCGGRSLNYVEADRLRLAEREVAGVRARDAVSGAEFDYRAPTMVNCAGPWSRELARRFDRDVPALFRPSLAFNALLDRPAPGPLAIALTARRSGGRTYFLRPLGEWLFAGTYHTRWRGGPDEPRPSREDLRGFLDDLNAAAPALGLHERDVVAVLAGLLPAATDDSDRQASREVIHDHGASGGPAGLFSVSGVKYTTARLVAEKTLRLICERRGAPLPPPRPIGRPEPAGGLELPAFARLLEEDATAAVERLRQLSDDEAVVYAEDWLLRRTDWGLPGQASPEVVAQVRALLDAGPHGARRHLTDGATRTRTATEQSGGKVYFIGPK